MNGQDLRHRIDVALSGFTRLPLPDAASDLFASLGYQTQRRLVFPSLLACLNEFDQDGRAAKCFADTAVATRPEPVLVQQLTSDEISGNSAGQLILGRSSEADTRDSIKRNFDSYLFIAVPLAERSFTRTELADAARALNSLFSQPVLVLFRHGTRISLAITYRRTSKRDQSRDVIERKVTFIKDIACAQPHPGHLSILEDFSVAALSKARQREIRSFADLDDAWRESLSAQLLNRQFYDEVANWYFWARDQWKASQLKLPPDAETEADASLFLIRLLTRLIFCWFLREKTNPDTGQGLIPEELFDLRRIPDLLRDSSPTVGTYYTAILQNLFFATLNTEMDAPDTKANRRFLEARDGQRSDEHMVHQLWRHAEQLKDPAVFETLFRRIPFLNGGLFECLDERVQQGRSPYTKEVRLDGFSSDPRKQPRLPNRLFFGKTYEETYPANLAEAYGDSARSHENVRPLLEIFRRYKFTLTENTPIEEEVALDPELLGHVFENLLAAYNPETGTVARKATGSFYTPRVVVDWMVDEALLVHLDSALRSVIRNPKSDFEPRIRDLLSWDGPQHGFSEREVEVLIDAIHSLKALDPACGSGAFPMGLLQKLVLILRKLDPGNQRWKARQIAAADAIESATARGEALKAIEHAFTRDNDDYGRKLYLIENCLYGVDIQPVAVQIAKLRFFIALVVDQKIAPREENYGILALPNLETKIVAANTLMGLKRGQLLLGSDRVRALERQLQQVRHDYFTARRYQDKKALRARDRELCAELATALAESGECTTYDAKRLAEWNPYNTNKPAPFFDPGWMFGLAAGRRRDAASARTTLRGNLGLINQVPGQMEIGAPSNDGANAGFDMLTGNPPYVRQEELKNQTAQDSNGEERPLKDILKGQYECFTGTADLYVYFVERSFQLLRVGGVLSFITSNKYFRAAYGERLRTYLLFATHPRVVLDFGDSPVFTAVAYPCILVAQKVRHVGRGELPRPEEFKLADRIKQHLLSPDRKFRVMTWTPGPPIRDFPAIFDEDSFPLAQRELKPTGWQLESPAGIRLLERISAAGKPLREYAGERVYRGLTTGLNAAFVVNRSIRDRLIKEHKSSAELLRPYLRGKDVERWVPQHDGQFLIKIPSSENCSHPWSGKSKAEAERIFAKMYPAIQNFHEQFRKALVDRYDQGHYFWELRACAYWQQFESVKLISTKVSIRPTFALETTGCYLGNTAYFLPVQSSALYLAALLNSSLSLGYAKRVFVEKQGGWYEVQPDGLESFPIPPATADQQRCCERLAEALIWLNSPAVLKKSGGSAPNTLMAAYFEQWLNGLVYELFFTGELHARQLRLFDETAKLALPALDKLSEAQKLLGLKELFEQAYDSNATIRSMLYSLRSLEVVRIIEQQSEESAKASTPGAE